MKAIIVEQTGQPARLGVIEEPRIEAGSILVAVKAASLNFPDLLMISGAYQIRPNPPFVLGKDAAGEVIAVGNGASGFAPGDRVLVQLPYGAFASRISVPAGRAFRLPDFLSYEQAAALGLAHKTAWLALNAEAKLQAGETVFVTGAAGGVGLAIIQTAKALGAKVIAGLTTAGKAGAVREAGADAVVQTGEVEETRKNILAANDGQGIGLAVDTVGGDAFDAALRSLKWKGRIVVTGFASGKVPSIKANYLLIKNIAVLGFSSNSYEEQAPEILRDAFAGLFELARCGMLPIIHRTFPIERFVEAFAELAERRAAGKIVLTFH